MAAFMDFAAEAKLACPVCERRRVRFSHPTFWFESRRRDEDARDRATFPLVGHVCRFVGAQSTA